MKLQAVSKGNIVNLVRPFVVSGDDILSNDCIEQFTLVLTTTCLIVLFDQTNLIKNCLVAIDYFMDRGHLEE